MNPTVFIVDDDPGMRRSLSMLLTTQGYGVESYASSDEFLAGYVPERGGCLILDIRMPGMSGLDLQEYLNSKGLSLPTIVISAHGDVASAVRAMKQGSVDFLEKPYSPQTLLDRTRTALELDRKTRAEKAFRDSLKARLAELTPREQEILHLVVAGKTSKMVADELGLSISTVDNHRANIMKKLKAETMADLARIALTADPELLRPPLN